MADIREKVKAVMARSTKLGVMVAYAKQTDSYDDWKKALAAVKSLERAEKAVRAHIRTYMRKTLPAKQAACPHLNLVDVKTRYTEQQVTVVEVQACTNCSKTFDLRLTPSQVMDILKIPRET